jgi:diguanylate cyclase (GGDEF)-like protein/PAS domain S-box-containing protein
MTERATSDQAADLRRRAEEKARGNEAETPETLSPEDARQVVHELRVHQIELEMQNEELRRAQAELEASRVRYFDLYDLAPVGYFTVSEQGLILEANLTAADLLGVARGALVKQPFSRLILPEDQGIYYGHRRQLFEAGAPQVWELRMTRAGGDPFWARLEATAAQEADGGPMCRVVLSDITERKRAEDELRRANDALETALRELQESLAREQLLARTDGLTGLYNHRGFLELAAREFSAALRYHRPLAILTFDADGLKQVNDTLGHTAGDKVLALVAQAAAAQIRGVDVLARCGGDEFVILLPQTQPHQALPIAERIRKSVAAMRMETDKGPLGVTVSVGIAEMWREPEDESVARVVQRADKALYAAKAEGRNRTIIYSAEMQGSEP